MTSQQLSLDAAIAHALSTACHVTASELTPALRLHDLGLDSLGLVVVLSRLEPLLGRQFTADETIEILNVDTVGDLTSLVHAMSTRAVA